MNFKILQKSGKARVGKLETMHGVIETPNFIPVGTKATVKALTPSHLNEIGAQIVLANTYHLMLQPGADLIKSMGGLHKFMGWNGPVMTDSGGFQVFSLGVGLESGEAKVLKQAQSSELMKGQKVRLAKVTYDGVTFQSHLDGKKFFLGPEECVNIQYKLGADLIVALDDHESITYDKGKLIKSLDLTENWALLSLKKLVRLKSNQVMYGVIHGSLHKDLRIKSAKFTDKHFNAIAIGGIYGTKKQMYEMINYVLPYVSEEKPRHLLGIGEVEDLFNGVEEGIDLFDCVAPMRRARNGSIYINPENGGSPKNNFSFNIRVSKNASDKKPLNRGCNCYTCINFSRSYINHLYRANEILYHSLSTYHNVFFIINLMKKIRNALGNRLFQKLKKEYMGT